MKISVVIPTYNEQADIRRTLDAVLALEYHAIVRWEEHLLEQRTHVADRRDVVEHDLLVSEERRGNDRQCGVLVARRSDPALERAAALHHELRHASVSTALTRQHGRVHRTYRPAARRAKPA